MDEQIKQLAISLHVLSEAIVYLMETESLYEQGVTRKELEVAAKQRSIFFDDNISDDELIGGIVSSMRSDLYSAAMSIREKITITE